MAVAAWWLFQGPGRGVFGGGSSQGSSQAAHAKRLLNLVRKCVGRCASAHALYQTPDGAQQLVPEWFGPSGSLLPDALQHGGGCAFTVGAYTSPQRIVLTVDVEHRQVSCSVLQRNASNGCFTVPVSSSKLRNGKDIERWLEGVLAPHLLERGAAAIERPTAMVHLFALHDSNSGDLRAVVAVDSAHSYGVLACATGHSSDLDGIGRLLRSEAEGASAKGYFTDGKMQELLGLEKAGKRFHVQKMRQVQMPGSDIPADPIEKAARMALEAAGLRVGKTMDFTAMVRGGMVTLSQEELA